jgi:hypothetical protein
VKRIVNMAHPSATAVSRQMKNELRREKARRKRAYSDGRKMGYSWVLDETTFGDELERLEEFAERTRINGELRLDGHSEAIAVVVAKLDPDGPRTEDDYLESAYAFWERVANDRCLEDNDLLLGFVEGALETYESLRLKFNF